MPNNEKMKRPDLKATLLLHSGGTVPDSHWLPYSPLVAAPKLIFTFQHKFIYKTEGCQSSNLDIGLSARPEGNNARHRNN